MLADGFSPLVRHLQVALNLLPKGCLDEVVAVDATKRNREQWVTFWVELLQSVATVDAQGITAKTLEEWGREEFKQKMKFSSMSLKELSELLNKPITFART
jgi:hypothetical protein